MNPATGISSTSAVLNATVNPGWASTTVRFLWRPSDSLTFRDSALAAESPLAGGTNQSASYFINGTLLSGKKYYTRARAYNSAGTAQTAQDSFTTLAAIPTISLASITNITQTGATVNGTVNPKGDSTTVKVIRGTSSTSYPDTFAIIGKFGGSGDLSVAGALTGLAHTTTYFVKLIASNAIGNAISSSFQQFTTQTPAATPPTVSSDSASRVLSDRAHLYATVTTGGAATQLRWVFGTASGVYQDSLDRQGLFTSSGRDSIEVKTYKGLPIVPGSRLYWKTRAYNSAGSAQGIEKAFRFTTIPVQITTLQPASVKNDSAKLKASVTMGGDTATALRFWWGTSSGSYNKSALADQSPASGNATISPTKDIGQLSHSTEYFQTLRAYPAIGDSVTGTEISFSTPPASPVAPFAVTLPATNIALTSATLNGRVDANGSNTTVRFLVGTISAVYPDSFQVSNPVVQNSIPVSWGLSGLTPETTYFFRIRAYNSAGAYQSGELSFVTENARPVVLLK